MFITVRNCACLIYTLWRWMTRKSLNFVSCSSRCYHPFYTLHRCFLKDRKIVKCVKMVHPICPLLNDHKQGYVCKALNSAFILDEDVENICKNSDAFPYCIHYSKTNVVTRNPPHITERTACLKCNSPQSCETLYFLLKEAQTPCEFKAYICRACGYTELYRAR